MPKRTDKNVSQSIKIEVNKNVSLIILHYFVFSF